MFEMCSGMFSDVLDKLGCKNQVSTKWSLNNSNLTLFGKIRTITLEDAPGEDENIKTGLGFLSTLNRGDVFLVKGSNTFAYFGELMARLAAEKEINGVIIDGLTRDTNFTQKLTLPIFAKGYSPVDIKGRGRVANQDVPVKIDGITVNSGDYVFGDSDALVFIPSTLFDNVMKEVKKVSNEEQAIKDKIAKGVTVEEILIHHKEF